MRLAVRNHRALIQAIGAAASLLFAFVPVGRCVAAEPLAAPRVDGALSTLESGASKLLSLCLRPPARTVRGGASDGGQAQAPSTLATIQCSRAFICQAVERQIDTRGPFIDEILGTRLVGDARTVGEIELELETRADRLIATIVFSGTIGMQTRGTNGPIVLESVGQTHFRATKRIVASGSALVIEPAVVGAETSCTTERLESTLPGFRGRIAERIAWRQVHETQAEVDAIAARHAEARLARALDDEFDHLATRGLKDVYAHVSRLLAGDGPAPRLRFCLTRTHLRICVEQGGAAAGMALEQAATSAEDGLDCDVSARLHRVLVQRALADGELSKLVPLLVSQLMPNPSTVRQAGRGPLAAQTSVNWSPDGDWLLLRYKAPPRAPHAALPTGRPSVAPQTPLAGVGRE